MNKRGVLYSLLVIVILFLDRWTKAYAITLAYPKIINNYLSFEYALNRGISWGFFHSSSDLVFSIITVLIAMVTISVGWVGYDRFKKGKPILGELLIVTGSFSNIFDRIMYGGVIDFIQFSIGSFSWPLFNIADSCIVIGVLLMMMEYYESN